jgi:hypothetical protein
MNTIILSLTIIVSLAGLYVSLNTIIETKIKYYNDYLKRKRNEKA